MRRMNRLRPTYSGVVATLALVLALGMGGAYAAQKIGSKSIAPSAIKSKHIRDAQVKTRDLAANVTVASARSAEQASTAINAETADRAARAVDAANAGRLEGSPAESFQRACEAGAIKGSVVLDTSVQSTTDSYVTVPGFNCSGGTVQVRKVDRFALGSYFVRFVGNPGADSAVASASAKDAALPGNLIGVTVDRVVDPSINERVFHVQTYQVGPGGTNNGSGKTNGKTFSLLAH